MWWIFLEMTDVSRNICRIAIVVKLREIPFVCGKQSVGTCDFGNPKAEEEIKASFCENFCEKSERFLLAVFCNLYGSQRGERWNRNCACSRSATMWLWSSLHQAFFNYVWIQKHRKIKTRYCDRILKISMTIDFFFQRMFSKIKYLLNCTQGIW